MPANVASSITEGWGIELSDTGWMKAEIGNVLHLFLRKNNVTFPIILFLDGHKTHLHKNLSNLCTALEIILVALYPNATRILQPADVATFRPVEAGWKDAVLQWRQDNSLRELTKLLKLITRLL